MKNKEVKGVNVHQFILDRVIGDSDWKVGDLKKDSEGDLISFTLNCKESNSVNNEYNRQQWKDQILPYIKWKGGWLIL